MKSFWLFLAGMVTGLLLMVLSYEYHLIMSEEGFLIVPKSESSLSNVYVDIREWSLSDWGDHPRVARSLIADGRSELVQTSVTDSALDQIIPSLDSDSQASNPLELDYK